jgi:hypothetical protein
VLHRAPRQFDHERSRWTLQDILATCQWLQLHTRSGLSRLLTRLKIHWKRGRDHLYSPDADYLEKLRTVQVCLQRVWRDDPTAVLLFEDELTYYRQPSVAQAYEAAGHAQPLAQRRYRRNTRSRIAAAVDAVTGQVHYLQRSVIGVDALVQLYAQICQRYGPGRTLYLAQDDWPVHFHPDVLAALQPQATPFPLRVPAHWPTEPRPQARRLNLPIQILPLPTYAPWTNPAEKLWRWLKQEELHLHRYADRWDELKQVVAAFLDRFGTGSGDLLRYVGLTVTSHQYGDAIAGRLGPPP